MLTKHNDLLGTLIHDVAYLLRREIDDRLKSYNLTRVKWLALGVIDKSGPMSQTELADNLELGAASVGRLVDRMVERGFVHREPDPDDRRSYLLSVTDTAKDLIQDLAVITDEFKDDTLTALSDAEESTLQSGLMKLKDKLTATTAAASILIAAALHKSTSTAILFNDLATVI